jgi:hypothetical protein
MMMLMMMMMVSCLPFLASFNYALCYSLGAGPMKNQLPEGNPFSKTTCCFNSLKAGTRST